MKVLTSWEIVQLFVEYREATGKRPGYKQQLIANIFFNISIYTWHDAKIRKIGVKGFSNH